MGKLAEKFRSLILFKLDSIIFYFFRVRQHIEHVESVRNQLQQQVNEARVDLEKDLSRRGENREKQIEELRERMRAHEEHVQNVRKNNDQRIKDLEVLLYCLL